MLIGFAISSLSVSSINPIDIDIAVNVSKSREYVVPTARSRRKPVGGISTSP